MKYKVRDNAGFTLIELLIATLVFTVLLIVITSGVLQFTHQYYRGVISAQTQNVARQLINNVAQAIEFSPGDDSTAYAKLSQDGPGSPSGLYGYCIGQTERYSFQLFQQITDVSMGHSHALVSDSTSNCTTATYALNVNDNNVLVDSDPNNGPHGAPPQNARELLGVRMRLLKFEIDPVTDGSMTGAYTIDVRVAYGDDDLLTDPTSANAACKSQTGDQFCAVAEYTTTVKKRVN